MSWIEEIEVSEAEGKLAQVYAELLEKRGKVANILQVHSLNPDAMANHVDLYMTIMFGKSGLSRAERARTGWPSCEAAGYQSSFSAGSGRGSCSSR